MQTLQDRIAELMRSTGWTVGRIAEISGVSSSAVTQWKDGPTKTLKTAPATRLAAASGFNALWIASGDGPMLSREASEALALPASPGQRFDAVTEDEHRMLLAFRGMSDDDRAELTAEMEQRAKRWAELVAKVLAQTRPAKNGTS